MEEENKTDNIKLLLYLLIVSLQPFLCEIQEGFRWALKTPSKSAEDEVPAPYRKPAELNLIENFKNFISWRIIAATTG